MEQYKKQANEKFFKGVLSMTSEGGTYFYPHIGEAYTVKGGKFHGTQRGVTKMKEITPKAFHKNIVLKGEG